jgi:hypothetical protein
MPTDMLLVKIALDTLACRADTGGPQDAIATEMEFRAGRPLTTQAVEECLQFCRDRAWADTRRDDFKRSIWWLTEAGKNRRQQL